MRFTFTILTFCILLLSCKKDNIANTPSSEYFPNNIGDYWRYKYVDSITNKVQNVDVKITGNTVLPGGQNAAVWTYTYDDHIDTNYVYRTGDTIRVIDNWFNIHNTYILPLQLNNEWRTDPYNFRDSITVIDNRAYNLNNHNFENSFLLYELGWLPNDYWNRHEWFCPYIGMITKNEKDIFTIGNQITSVHWELIAYQLK